MRLVGSWLVVTDVDENGESHRRIDNPKDYVRREIARALHLKKRVIPVLIDGASIPSRNQLPRGLKELAFRNAITLNEEKYDEDLRHLVDALLGK